MTDFIIKKLPYDLSSHAGLAFIGKYLKSIKINSLIDSAFPVRSGVANSDILKSYLALLCLGNPSSTANPDFSRFRLSGLNKIKHLQLMF